MSEQVTVSTKVTFEQIFQLAQQLSPAEQARLVAQLAPRIERYLNHIEPVANEPVASSPQLSRGQKMAATLQKIAETSGASSFGEPLEWQKQTRDERILPGRE